MLSSNLCRCTGYGPILAAASRRVKAPPFAYARAESLDDALALLGEAGDEAKLLAGGQSLVPLLAYRILRPTHLVDIDALTALATRERTEDGPPARGARAARAPRTRADRRRRARARRGRRARRARPDPDARHARRQPRPRRPGRRAPGGPPRARRDGARPLARRCAGRPGRGVPPRPVHDGLEPDEAIVAVTVPAHARQRVGAFEEFAVRSGDFALAAAAVVLPLDGARARDVRIALGAVDATAIRAAAAESLLDGAELTDEAIAEAAEAAAAECDPASDATTTAAYRRALVARLVRDALVRIAERAPA